MNDFHKSVANKLAKIMDKEKSYKLLDIPKLLAQADFAVMHSKDQKEIVEELKEMGFNISESKMMFFDSFLFEKGGGEDVTPREVLMDKLRKKFPNIWIKRGEEFSKEKEGSIWTGAEGKTFVDKNKKIPAFNAISSISYDASKSKDYVNEVHKRLADFLAKEGWYTESHDPGTFFFYPI